MNKIYTKLGNAIVATENYVGSICTNEYIFTHTYTVFGYLFSTFHK